MILTRPRKRHYSIARMRIDMAKSIIKKTCNKDNKHVQDGTIRTYARTGLSNMQFTLTKMSQAKRGVCKNRNFAGAPTTNEQDTLLFRAVKLWQIHSDQNYVSLMGLPQIPKGGIRTPRGSKIR